MDSFMSMLLILVSYEQKTQTLEIFDVVEEQFELLSILVS